MKLVFDRATEAAAVNTLRKLIDQGFAGLDCYDASIFVVDAPTDELRDYADVAIGVLNGQFHRDGAYGAPKRCLQAQLPSWVRAELGLDGPDAPELIMPLASRALGYRESVDPGAIVGSLALASLDRLIDEVQRP